MKQTVLTESKMRISQNKSLFKIYFDKQLRKWSEKAIIVSKISIEIKFYAIYHISDVY